MNTRTVAVVLAIAVAAFVRPAVQAQHGEGSGRTSLGGEPRDVVRVRLTRAT
jgi:hypothetical protein